MLSWFDANPAAYWCIVLVSMAIALYSMLRPFLLRDWVDEKKTDWPWSVVIIALLAAGRWPTLFLTRHYSPDECQLIASARTLRYDPVFWRSVDGMTAGPLDYFALWPAGTLLGDDCYASARLTALALIAVALIFAYQTLASLFGRQLARITIFSAVCVEALTKSYDLLHYSTELVSMSLLSIAFFLFTQRFFGASSRRWNALGGLILGCVPLAKPQAAPAAALIGLSWIVGECLLPGKAVIVDRLKSLTALIVSAVTPVCLTALIIAVYGLWPYFKLTYFEHNIAYVDAGLHLPLYGIFTEFVRLSGNADGLLFEWLGGGFLWLALTFPVRKTVERPIRIFALVSILLFAVSLGCVLLPHRPYIHYWQLVIVPWTLVLGANLGLIIDALGKTQRLARCIIQCSLMLFSFAGVLYARAGVMAPLQNSLVFFQNLPQADVVIELSKYTRHGESMAMWGWMPEYFVEARLRQATRRNVSNAEIDDGPFRDRFRQVYLNDLQRSAPPVFLDATGPGNFNYDDRKYSFESAFPALADYIHSHYVLASDAGGSRVYVRRDRWSASTEAVRPFKR